MSQNIQNFLAVLMPACACFGPLFLIFGILGRTSGAQKGGKTAGSGFLWLGGLMITLVLWAAVMHINAPK